MSRSYACDDQWARSCSQGAVDKILSACTLRTVETLASRVSWLLQQTGMSARALSLKAGLSPNHVGMLARGAVATRPSHETLSAVARAAGVSLAWLADGEGEPGLRAADTGQQPGLRLEYVERYPSRREAAEAMAGLIRQDAIVGVLRWNLHNEEDPGMAWWIERMKELARQADLRDKSPAAVEQDKQRGLADTERVREQLAAARARGSK